jgi:hypothetical protein
MREKPERAGRLHIIIIIIIIHCACKCGQRSSCSRRWRRRPLITNLKFLRVVNCVMHIRGLDVSPRYYHHRYYIIITSRRCIIYPYIICCTRKASSAAVHPTCNGFEYSEVIPVRSREVMLATPGSALRVFALGEKPVQSYPE